MRTITENAFTAYWLGKCPVKGCSCRLHLDVPMTTERWTETRHDHARGQRWEVPQRREYPGAKFGKHWRPYSLGMACTVHKRDLVWTPINGRLSESHVCDARCMNATGPNCECSCGGANHGRGFHVELKFN